MAVSTESTLLYVHGEPLSDAVVAALRSSAEALGHKDGCSFATPAELAAYAAPHKGEAADAECTDVGLALFALDPWAVVAVDELGIVALQGAFGDQSAMLAPDKPVEACGYTLVAVPEFAACLDDQPAKRVAWTRLKAARHPGNPLD